MADQERIRELLLTAFIEGVFFSSEVRESGATTVEERLSVAIAEAKERCPDWMTSLRGGPETPRLFGGECCTNCGTELTPETVVGLTIDRQYPPTIQLWCRSCFGLPHG